MSVGGIGAVAVGRAMVASFAGVDAFDPLTLGASAGALLTAALGAAAYAARRVTSVDPVAAMRAD